MSSHTLRVGIVGLPNVGKSTLFNALLKKRVALSANYPFTTVEPNVGVVALPDERLEKLAQLMQKEEKMENPPPVVPTVMEFVDIAGLVKGAHQGEGLGNQFLVHIREVDAILHVLRDFTDENVVKAGSENPDADRLTVETELALADLQTIDKLIKNAENEAKIGTTLRYSRGLYQGLVEIKRLLEQGKMAREFIIQDHEMNAYLQKLPLLTIKPVLYVYNVDEQRYKDAITEFTLERSERLQYDNSIVISAKIEEELVDLSEEERSQYLAEFDVSETGLERLIRSAYKLLDLISFFTTKGGKEVKAWTIKSGTKALQAAGVIHTDFERGFIKTHVIDYDKLIEAGSYAEAKNKGWVRTEGKDYKVSDGDVIEFLVST